MRRLVPQSLVLAYKIVVVVILPYHRTLVLLKALKLAQMVKDEQLVELGFPKYWDERYAARPEGGTELSSFEWFRDFSKLRPFFDKHLPKPPSTSLILQLGCGNSVGLRRRGICLI